MALSITSVTPCAGGNHIVAVVNHEGTPRTFSGSLQDIDSLFESMTPLEQLWLLCRLWAKYRRQEGRAITGVNVA